MMEATLDNTTPKESTTCTSEEDLLMPPPPRKIARRGNVGCSSRMMINNDDDKAPPVGVDEKSITSLPTVSSLPTPTSSSSLDEQQIMSSKVLPPAPSQAGPAIQDEAESHQHWSHHDQHCGGATTTSIALMNASPAAEDEEEHHHSLDTGPVLLLDNNNDSHCPINDHASVENQGSRVVSPVPTVVSPVPPRSKSDHPHGDQRNPGLIQSGSLPTGSTTTDTQVTFSQDLALLYAQHGDDDDDKTTTTLLENEDDEEEGVLFSTTRFADIIGHTTVKLRLEEVLLPLALPPELADSILTGIRSLSASILLHGPPGTGKTQLAKAIAGEAHAAFFSVGPSDILSKYVGESEASIRSLFETAIAKARQLESRCSVLFFDEIDALGQNRGGGGGGDGDISSHAGGGGSDTSSRRILSELLIQLSRVNTSSGSMSQKKEVPRDNEVMTTLTMNSLGDGNTPIAAHSTNTKAPDLETSHSILTKSPTKVKPQGGGEGSTLLQPEAVGSTTSSSTSRPPTPQRRQQPVRIIVVAATNRPEDCDPALIRRFAVRVLVGLPHQRERKRMIRRFLKDVPHDLTSHHLDEVAIATRAWSGSDLESLTREAAMAPVRECIRSAAHVRRQFSRSARSSRGDGDAMRQQQSGDSTAQNDVATEKGVLSLSSHRDLVLDQFRNLRVVTLDDFREAIAFSKGDVMNDDSHTGKGPGSRQTSLQHYDSSSEEDD